MNPASPFIPAARGRKGPRLGTYMVHDKGFFPKFPKFKYARRRKTERQEYGGVHRTVMNKVRGCMGLVVET